jgi:hypothetical protein
MEHHIDPRNRNSKETAKAKKTGLAGLAALTLSGVLGPVDFASAQAAPEPLAAGIGCPFRLAYNIAGEQTVYKEWKDENGNVVRFLNAGRGTTNTYTNVETGASITLKPSGGSVSRRTVHPDGSATFVGTGFNTIIWFPTDVPAGPATTLYIGRVVFTITPEGNFILDGTSGKQMDICTMLSAKY